MRRNRIRKEHFHSVWRITAALQLLGSSRTRRVRKRVARVGCGAGAAHVHTHVLDSHTSHG